MPEDASRATQLATAIEHLDMDHAHLWVRYVGLGGNGTLSDLGQWVSGKLAVGDSDYDVVAHALNEAFADRAQGRPIPYAGGA